VLCQSANVDPEADANMVLETRGESNDVRQELD